MNDIIVTVVYEIQKRQFNEILCNKDIIPITSDYLNINNIELIVDNREFIYNKNKLEQIILNCKL